MTYEEAERHLEKNLNKIKVSATEFKFMAPIIASNTADSREQERIFKEVIEKGVNNDFVLRDSGDINSDLNVFVICQRPNGLLATIPLSGYLEMISQNEV